ncbi:MAG: AAA family ATPase [Candidatus Hatepunaea meridiana]|nr:AAA family ATPase [Candidatus Hatepunaea meridiana]
MIKRLYIDGYKSFKGFEVELQPLSVIFGPNGSGKSNLIDAIHLLSDLCTSKNIVDAFKDHRGDTFESFYYGNGGFNENLKKEKMVFTFEVDIELSEASINTVKELINSGSTINKRIEKYLRYNLKICATPESGYIKVLSDELLALKKNGELKVDQNNLISKVRDKDTYGSEENHNNHLESDYLPSSTRIGLAESGAIYPSAYAFRLEVEKWRTYRISPDAMRKDFPLRDIRYLSSDGSDIAPFLNVLKDRNYNAYDNVVRVLKTILPHNPCIRIKRPKPAYLSIEIDEDGIGYSSRLTSDGTLRVLGLIAALRSENNSTLIAIEEPENGVHPVRLSQISDIINNAVHYGKRQIIITTHSTVFPKYFENEYLFVCRKDNSRTNIKPFVSLGEMYKNWEIRENLDNLILRRSFGG